MDATMRETARLDDAIKSRASHVVYQCDAFGRHHVLGRKMFATYQVEILGSGETQAEAMRAALAKLV